MSDVSSRPASDIVFLLPNEIKTDKRYSVRPFSSTSNEKEDRRILALAAAIESVGQIDPVLISQDHILVAGHRRRKAVIVINEKRSAIGKSLLRLKCEVDHTGKDLRRKAIISNLHRRDGTPMDMAYMVTDIRQENNWAGWDGAKKVAEYLNIDATTVLQYEKLLGAEKELQNQVHDGIVSVQSALALMKQVTTPKERAAVLERAQTIQAEEKLDKVLDQYSAGKRTLREVTQAIENPSPRVAHPAVVAAIREKFTVTPAPRKFSLTRTELIQSIGQFDTDDVPYGFRRFAHYWVHRYAVGLGTREELRAVALAADPTGSEQPQPHTMDAAAQN